MTAQLSIQNGGSWLLWLQCWVVESTVAIVTNTFHRTSSYFSVTFCYSLTFNINSKSKGLSFQLNCIAYMHCRRLYYARPYNERILLNYVFFFFIKTAQVISVVGYDTYLFINSS